jgi:YtkA-like
MKTFILTALFIALTASIVLLGACGSSAPATTSENPVQGKIIKSGTIGNNLTVSLSNDSGKLKSGEQEFSVVFTDAAGKAVDVGAASLNFHMPAMGSMAPMNDSATLTTTATPGVYKARMKISMPGEWQVQIAFEGSTGNGKTSLPVTTF